MPTLRRTAKSVLYGGVLAGLVAGLTGLVVLGVEPDALPAPIADTFGIEQTQVQAEPESAAESSGTESSGTESSGTESSGTASSALTAGISADIPLLNTDLTSADIVALVPASRGAARDALLDGNGVTFTLVVDGVTTELTSAADTVGEALQEQGIALGWDDEVSLDLTSPLTAGAQIVVGRSTTTYVTEQVVTPHASEQRETSELLIGRTRVVQQGVDGDQRITSAVRSIDGVEVERTTVLSAVLTDPVTEIIEVGTRQPVVVTPPVTRAPNPGTSNPGTAKPASPAPVGSPNADTSGNRALGKELMLGYGFAEDQWSCLEALWTKESGWNHLASNRSSGAYGIPQALPGSKMGNVGADWATNPATQIQWGLGYIAGRYGTPCGAWGAFQAKGWY